MNGSATELKAHGADEDDGIPPSEVVGADQSKFHSLQTQERGEDQQIYPSGIQIILIILALCLSVLCVALDNTIISTAIPRITDDFHALQNIGWYGSAYLLTTCSFQLFYGKLYNCYNAKFVFLAAISIFEIGSIVCASSQSSVVLIVGRAVAGLGAAGIFSGALLIIANSSPVHKRAAYTGFVGSMWGLASVAGPLMGGVFTDKVTWRWCFWINLPVGGVSAGIVLLFLKSNAPGDASQKKRTIGGQIWQMDPIGNLLFVSSIVCLLLALKWGGSTYAWSNGRIIALLVLFALLLVAFIVIQLWLGEAATVPPRIASQRTIAAGSIFGFLIGGAFFLLVYFLPVWFQAIKGVDALRSGINNIPLVLSMAFAVVLAGGLTTKFGFYMPYVYTCVIMTSIATALLTTLAPNTGASKWVGYQILFGIGCGLAFQLPQIAAQAVLPLKDVAQGVSMTFFAETLGGAVFVSVGNNVLDRKLIQYIGALNIPSVDPAVVVNLGATQLRSYVPPEFVEETVQAYNHAIVDTLRIALILACLSALGAIGMEWRSVHEPLEREGE